MPIIDNDSTFAAPFPPQGEAQSQQIAEQGAPAPVARENRFFPTLPTDDIRNVFGTSLSSENSIGEMIGYAGYLSQLGGVDHTPDPNFDAWQQMQKEPGMEQYPQLGEARNLNEYNVMAAKIKQEEANSATMNSAGVTGTLVGLGAGLADPINFIPGVGVGEDVYRAAKFGRGTVEGLTHGATAGLFAGAAGAGVNYATNLTPTLQDEAYSIGGSSLLGGMLGGSFGALSDALRGGKIAYNGVTLKTPDAVSASISDASRTYAENLRAADGDVQPFYPGSLAAESAGAARAPRPDTTLEQEGLVPANIVPNKLAAALPDAISNKLDLTKTLSFSDPTLALMNSPEVESRRAVQLLADVPAEVQKNRDGIASSPYNVEAIIKQWEGQRARTDMAVHDIYNQYRFGRDTKVGDSLRLLPDAVRQPKDKLTVSDFSNEVDRAMRNNDSHPIPEVAKAAKLYRDQLVEPLKEQAIKLGMFDPDVKAVGAPSYAPRSYNVPYVIANRPQLENIIARSFKRSNVNITERYDNFNTQAAHADNLVKQYSAKRDEAQKLLSGAVPLNREHIKNFNILQREMQVLKKQHDRLQTRADAAKERVKTMTPAQASDEFKTAIGHVKNGVPKSMKAKTLSEWIRSAGGLKDDGGDVRALGGGGKDQKLVNNKSGMSLDDAALRAQEAGYFPDSEGRPDIKEFLDTLHGDAQGSVPRYSENDFGNVDYENYIHQLGQELDQRGIDVNKLSPGQIENLLRDEAPGASDRIAQRAKMREAEYAQRRADSSLQSIKDEIKRRQLRFDDIRVKRDETSAAVKSVKAELEDIENIISANNEKSQRFHSQAKDVMYIARADDAELLDLAKSSVDGIVGLEPGRIAYKGIPMTRGPLKERVLPVLDSEIHDFIDHDVFRNMRKYQHTMASDAALTRVFGRPDMQQQFQKINTGYDVQRMQLGEKYGVSSLKMGMDSEGKWNGEVALNDAMKDLPPELQKELTALNVHQQRDIDNLSGVRDRLRGTYGAPANPYSLGMRTYRVIKQLNYMRSLGMQALTALSHAAKIPMAHGVMRFMGDGVAAFARNGEQFRLAASEVRMAGTALEMASNATQLALNGLSDDWSGYSKFERGVTGLSDNFRFVTLMAPFISSLKTMSGVISQTRSLEMIEAMAKGGETKPAELARLAKYGIDTPMAQRIFNEVDQHGTKKDDIWWANTSAWADQQAAEVYRMALQRETDKIIVTPGQDTPLFMSRPMGSMLLQFRSFAFASVQRTLISGLQQRDMAVLNGFMAATAIGMFSYWAKTSSDRLSDDPAVWAAEGIDRAGAFGWFDDLNNAVEKLTGNRVGMQSLAGEFTPKQQKFDSSQAAAAILGPTYSTVFTTMLPLLNDIGGGNFNQNDLHLMRQMLPGQNWFAASKIMDQAEQGVNSTFSIPKKHRQ